MSVLTLPVPANWSDGRRTVTRAKLCAVLLVAVAIVAGAERFWHGDRVLAYVFFSLAIPFALVLAALQINSRRRTAVRARHDAQGTTFLPDRNVSAVMAVAIASFIPIGIAVVIFTLTGDLHLVHSRRGQAGAVGAMTIVAGIAVSGLIATWRRGAMGYVKLTTSGIDVADMKDTESVAWDDILAVDDHSEVNEKTHRAIVVRLEDGTETIIGAADLYVPDGAGLYWMVRHYWRHSDDRAELADGRALERLRDGRFDTGVL